MTRAWLLLGIVLFGTALPFSGCRQSSAPDTNGETYFRPNLQTAGQVRGRAVFTGARTKSHPVNMDGDPQCERLHDRPVVDEEVALSRLDGEDRLANVFVYVKSGLEGKVFEPPNDPVVIEQRGCWFGPRVQGIMVGQTFKVINSDPLTHNIHPLAKINREWNQSQSPGDAPLTRRFSQPEVMVRIKCNIHHWMHAWVGAVAHPYFAVTGSNGIFNLTGLPPGSYTIEAWHERLGRVEHQVTLAEKGHLELIFSFMGEEK
ncbi:MAG: hypothetical protein EBU88_10280 [Acidobacteria bacterium]|nr:hypothetical protein [Acidobacteriota bacterium]